jgi:hypothetical protein
VAAASKKSVGFKEGGEQQQKDSDAADHQQQQQQQQPHVGLNAIPVQYGGLLSRSGLVDDYRYIPHPIQLLVTDYDPQAAVSHVYSITPPEPRHSGSKVQRHFVESAILTSLADLLGHYHALVKLSRSHSVMSLTQRDALTVLHYACPAPETARTADELREQRRRNARYRVAAWSHLEAAWRAHMVVLQRDLGYFVQQQSSAAAALTQDGFLEPAGVLEFLATAHRVMFLKFNVLARGTVEELKSLDAINVAQEGNAAAALNLVNTKKQQAAAADGGAASGGENDDDTDNRGTAAGGKDSNNNKVGGASGGGADADKNNSSGTSFAVANQRALTATHAQNLALRRELTLLANDLLRHRDWSYRIDSFAASEEFVNRAAICRQSRTSHPMVLFLQQLRDGIRRVYVPVASTSSSSSSKAGAGGGGGGGAGGVLGGGGFGARTAASGGGVSSGAAADDAQTRYMALPPHAWPYSGEVGLTITRAVQAMVGVPPTALAETAAHTHHLMDTLFTPR